MPTRLAHVMALAACVGVLAACTEAGTPVPSGGAGTGTQGSSGLPTTTAEDNREPTTVDGYPGVWQEGVDLRDEGHCTISVGITDQLHISVFSRRAEPSTACDQVKEIAGAVVDTLRQNGR